MTELTEEEKKAILQDIISVVSTPVDRPPNSITSQEYADEAGCSRSRAGTILRQGVMDGKLGYEKRRGVGYWWLLRNKND